jgi:methionyl-tRNA formyltransferase
MRIIFAGTPEFAAVALQALLAAGHQVPLVLTQPDRPAGRGMKLQASPVKQVALAHGIALAQPHSLKLDGKYPQEAAAAQAQIAAAQADVMVVAAYGLILPQWTLDTPRLGCMNIHASLLPRWRGAAPIHRAIEAGDAQTGITIMQMDAGLDTGDMLLVRRLNIDAADSTASLHDKLAALGGSAMVQALALAETGDLLAQAQPEQGVTYAEKIRKDEAQLDWAQSAAALVRKSRALDPFPGCVTSRQTAAGTETLKIWRLEALPDAQPAAQPAVVGQVQAVDASGITIACGTQRQGRVLATQLQKAGGKRLPAAQFLAGFALQIGDILY